MPTQTAAPPVPTPTVATPPAVHQGRRGKQLDETYVKAIFSALDGLADGDVVATGEQYDEKTKARKAVELVRRELIRVCGVKREQVGTRIWQDGDAWVGGVHNRDAS